MKIGRISNNHLEEFMKMVDQADTIAIASHINPDGDNLGSTLALRKSLELYGKDVEVLGLDTIDDYLLFMPEIDKYKKPSRDSYDLFMILDASEYNRIGELTKVADKSTNTLVIDHHVGGKISTDLNMIYDDAPATCEIIYELIDNLKLPMDKDIASLLYTGILTDTGRFLYSNVSKITFEAAGNLINLGADTEYIHKNLYQSKPIKVMKFQTEIISKAEFFDKKAFAVIRKEDVEKFGVQMGDAETIVNMLRDLNEVEVSMIVKEYDNKESKISLRSKDVDVSELARKCGGGGHIRASGFSIYDLDLEQAINKSKDLLKQLDV